MFVLCSVLLVLGVGLAASQEACLSDGPRTDCGKTITSFINQNRVYHGDGMIWDPSIKYKVCIEYIYMIGYLGVDQNGCEANGCCWNPKDVSYY